jgi:hypothetical protein
MTVMEKVEQRFTGRADSYVPAHTLARMLRLRRPSADRPVRNHVMHWGTGIVLGGLRGVMAQRGLRGPGASALHAVARLSTDQTLENATGVGAPPWTWPRQELVIDVAHKAVYSFVTGWVADRLIAPRGAARDTGAVIDVGAVSAMPESVVDGDTAAEAARLPEDMVVNASPS